MKGSSLVASKAALALLAADAVFADVLTTIDPCPSATGLAVAPITVTAQYQAVSTCQPTSACVKGKCSTTYDFTTYPYVSTVVPYAWDGTTSQSTTVTDVSQPVRVSEHLETLTQVTAAPTLDKRWGFGWGNKEEVVESVTVYETVTRRAMAPFKDCGRLPIPSWEGSGLCEQCESSGSQLLDVVECRFGTDASGDEYGSCSEWYETLYERVAPTTTAEARCSSSGNIPSAGVYTWTFPQPAAPVTVTAPPTTVTVYIEEQPSVTVIPAEIQVVQGESWNAYVTKTFAAATIFDFEIYITQPIVYAPFPATWAAPSTAAVSVPTGSSASKGSWPLPEQAAGGNAYSSASTVWADWTPAPTSASTSGSGSGVSTSSNNIGPISASTSSGTSSNIIGPISASTSTSSSSSGSATSTSSSSSSTTGSSSTSSSSSSSSVTSTSSSSSSSSSSTTSTTTTTTGGTAVTIGVGFYLEIVATPVVRVKRQDVTVQYLAFDANNEGIAVQDQSSAALVFDGEGNALVSDGMFLGTPAGDTSLVERTSTLPEGFSQWYFVGSTAQLQGTAGFCLGANDTVTAYVAGDICNNPIFLAQQNTTASSTTSSSSTSAASSTTSSKATTTASGASSSTATSTSSVKASSTASSTGTGSATTSSSTSASRSSTLSSTTSSTSSGLTISVSVGPISLTTSSSSSGTATATTSSTSSSSTPICNINANICPNSELITANTVATSDCTAGVTCTTGDLAELVPDLLTQNPSIATVLLGNNQAIGLSITPQDVQAAIANGTLTDVCTGLDIEPVTVQIDDPTCISGTGTTSSSSTTAAATSSSSASSTSSSSMITSTTSATTTTDQTSSTTSTTTSASASSTLLCGVQIALCAGQTLQDLGLNTVTCGTTGAVCDASEAVEAAGNACVGNCESFGSVLTTTDGTTTANTVPVIGTESIQTIQAQENTGCTPGNQTVTLSQPGCPLTVLKRRTEFRHARARYAY